MTKHRLTILVLIFVLETVATPYLQTWRTKAVAQDPETQSKPLTWILADLGRNYDCFFTIEDGAQEDEPGNRLEAEWTRRTLANVGLAKELERLRQTVPNFSYEFNPANSRIMHIIDARLKQQKGYALDRTIDSLDFTGKVNELPDAIGKQGIPIALPTWQSTHEQRDGSTILQVKGGGLTVRDALSNFISLDGRASILWIARTKLEPGAISYVFYPWPGKMVER